MELYLWSCPRARDIWVNLKKLIHKLTGYRLYIKPSYILLNMDIVREESTPDIKWRVIKITTQYLYVSKCLDKTPTFSALVNKLKERERIEREMAIEGRHLYTHIGKWGTILPQEEEVEFDNDKVIIF